MSLICFPFKQEHIPTVLRNVEIAADHPKVSMVLLSAACDNDCFREVIKGINAKNCSTRPYRVPIRVEVQERMGSTLRPGKGDGMNFALKYFLNAHNMPENNLMAPLQRIHFYDADIESFDSAWISKAEDGASQGYDVIRHYFPRSSTDAQVTWQITKVGFALLWAGTTLPWVQQPLGGELCFTRPVVEALMADKRVVNQSNWGIDTLYTFVCAQKGFSLLEVYMPQGKMHALYGGLRDIRTMALECFAAVQSLQNEDVTTSPTTHRIDPPAAVPTSVTQKIGYCVEKSLGLLRENWTDRQQELLTMFRSDIQDGLLAASEWPEYLFMTEEAWICAYQVFLEHFDLNDEDWRELFFKMWVARVLNYTMRHVMRGYTCALQANTDMVRGLQMKRAIETIDHHRFSALDLTDAGSDVQSTDEHPPSPEHEWCIKTAIAMSPMGSSAASEDFNVNA